MHPKSSHSWDSCHIMHVNGGKQERKHINIEKSARIAKKAGAGWNQMLSWFQVLMTLQYHNTTKHSQHPSRLWIKAAEVNGWAGDMYGEANISIGKKGPTYLQKMRQLQKFKTPTQSRCFEAPSCISRAQTAEVGCKATFQSHLRTI